MEHEVCVNLNVFTADDAEFQKVVEAFKNVTIGLALDGVRVGMSIHPIEEEEAHDTERND